MPFEKGTSGNETGRPKGSSNKATSKVRDAYTQLLENNLEQLKDDFKDLDPKDRIKLFLDLSKYVIPQLKQVEQNNFNLTPPADLTPEEIENFKKDFFKNY